MHVSDRHTGLGCIWWLGLHLVLGHAGRKVLLEGAQRCALRAESAIGGAPAAGSRLGGLPQGLACRKGRPLDCRQHRIRCSLCRRHMLGFVRSTVVHIRLCSRCSGLDSGSLLHCSAEAD